MTNYHPACWLKLAQSHRTHWGQACKVCGEGKGFSGLTWARHEMMELSKRCRITWTRPGHQTWKFYKFKYFEHDLGNQSLPPPNKQSVDWQPSGKNFIISCTCRLGRPQILWPWSPTLQAWMADYTEFEIKLKLASLVRQGTKIWAIMCAKDESWSLVSSYFGLISKIKPKIENQSPKSEAGPTLRQCSTEAWPTKPVASSSSSSSYRL